MKAVKFLSCVLAVAALAGCATHETSSTGLELMSAGEVDRVLDRSTSRSQNYEGLYNTLDLTATLRNSAVRRAQLEQQARIYQWDRNKFQAEVSASDTKSRNETEVFLSFYTPEKKNDDLNKKATQWKVFLESDGRRFEGKAAKIRQSVPEIQGWYPYFTRFSTPYSVTFTVATQDIETKPAKFIVTGPMGTATLNFAPVTPP